MADFEQRLAMELRPRPFSDRELEELQRLTFDYFLKETNPENGLVPDSTREGAPCSIAPTGFALAAYPVGVERGFITRDDAISRTLTSLRFFWQSALPSPGWRRKRQRRDVVNLRLCQRRRRRK